jgi:dihydrofolate reductase
MTSGRQGFRLAGMKPIVSLIVARSQNGVIGRKGALPWHISADLKHFKRLTVGKPVVMGRKTFDSIGKALPARHNIVVTRSPDWRADGVTVVPNLAEAIAAAGLDLRSRASEIMIIGGGDIYAQCMAFAQRMYLTDVQVTIDGDTFFAAPDPAVWHEQGRVDHSANVAAPAFSWRWLERRA